MNGPRGRVDRPTRHARQAEKSLGVGQLTGIWTSDFVRSFALCQRCSVLVVPCNRVSPGGLVPNQKDLVLDRAGPGTFRRTNAGLPGSSPFGTRPADLRA